VLLQFLSDEYARSDVLLKLSSVEGMFGPPLEAFHRGATAVVTPVTEDYGWRVGRVVDPYGHHWEIGHPLEN